jgi:hypothetical protein
VEVKMDDWREPKKALAAVAATSSAAVLAEDGGDNNTSIPTTGPVARRIKALEKLQTDVEAVDEEYYAQRREIEKKYEAKRQEYYVRRAAVVHGSDGAATEITKANIESNGK